jgi:hypothetical protein
VTNSTSNPDLCWICYRVFTESGTTCEGGAGPGRRRGEEGQGHGSSGVGRRGRSRAEGADRGNTDVGRRGRVGAAPGQCRVLERIGPRSACRGPKDERTPGDAAESAGANHRRRAAAGWVNDAHPCWERLLFAQQAHLSPVWKRVLHIGLQIDCWRRSNKLKKRGTACKCNQLT